MSRITSAAIILTLVLGSQAVAQKRKTASSDDGLGVGGQKAKNVIKPDSGKDTYKPENAEIEKLVTGMEKRLSKVRQRQIKKMRDILAKNPLYRNKANLLFRIAEKEWDEAKYRYALARADYEKRYEAFLNETLKVKPKEPEADYSKALNEYQQLLKEFPNYRRIDEVMYYLGKGLITAGKKRQGAAYMRKMFLAHPRSKYKTAAHLAVAEFYFDEDLLTLAQTQYIEVLKDKQSPQYPVALYKLGYVHYNLQAYDESIAAFQKVVQLSKGKDKRKIYFTNQAYSALTLAYAETTNGWRKAQEYFFAQGGHKLANGKLESIARIYNKQDKSQEEVDVYEYLIGNNKEGKKVPEYASYITKSYKKQEKMEKAEETINRFVKFLDPKRKWYSINSQYEEPRIRSNQYREEEIDWLITRFHKKAQESEKKKDLEKAKVFYDKAVVYYEQYIELFPKSKFIYEYEFFLAEIYYFQMKKWEDAAKHYRRVVEIDPKGKYSKESAYAVILAKQEKMVDAGLIKGTEKTGKKGKKRSRIQKASVTYVKTDETDDFKPIPKKDLQPLQTDFLEACAFYVDTYPKDNRVPEVSFLSAEIWIDSGHYKEGVKRLEVLLEYHSKHKFAGHAAAKLFDANYRLRDWDQMERWGRYMLQKKNFKVLSKKKLLGVIAISINEYATELNKNGEKDKAAKEMLRFVGEFPKHEKAPIALFNAAAITEQAERTKDAINLYEKVIRDYEKSPQATESHWVLGLLYESQTDFETAAKYFEKMASFPDVPQMADALYNAGSIRAALEQFDQAIQIFETFAAKFPENETTPELILEIGRIQEKQKQWTAATKTYNRYLKTFGKKKSEMVPGIFLKKALIIQREGGKRTRARATAELKKAEKAYGKLDEKGKENAEVRQAMAKIMFLLAEYKYDDFEAIQLSFPENKLKKGLVAKAKLLGECEKLFFEVTKYKAWHVSAGALYRIGESYYLYSKSLFDLPMPPGLSEDEEFTYRAMLEDRASPLEEKAIGAMKNALKLAHKNHVYNEWSRKAAALLAKKAPELYPVIADATVNSEWTVPATFSTRFNPDPNGKLDRRPPPKPVVPVGPGQPGKTPKAGDTSPQATSADGAAAGAVK
ncbi:MAG: tetratricopeptide repeat protein [Myxococcota bacterium]|nr:tetratricopeptide repeat protein [Myxococcota bacterium]